MEKFKKIKYISTFVFAIALLLSFKYVWATDLGMNEAAGLGLPSLTSTDPKLFIINIIRFLLGFVGIVVTVYMIYGGWLWMTSAGSPERVQKAKRTIIAALVGLLIVIFSFIIVSFVANMVRDVITNSAGGTCDPACDAATEHCCSGTCMPIGTPCSTGLPPGTDTFYIKGTNPYAVFPDGIFNIPRNVIVKLYFNRNLNNSVDAILNTNFTVTRIESNIDTATTTVNEPITGNISYTGRSVINFVNPAACGDERNTPNCFESWSTYEVRINTVGCGLSSCFVDIDGQALDCSNGRCTFRFHTNNLVDTLPPTAGMVPAQICQDDGTLSPDANIVGGWGTDDVAVADLQFFLDGAAESPVFVGMGERRLYEDYQYDTTALVVGTDHNFSVAANDMVGGTANANFTATVRVGHCCNGVRDVFADGDPRNEEDIDCGGSECNSCSLMDPIITNITPGDGAPGNFITISGRHFGTTQGSVFFSSTNGIDIPASFPSSPPCSNNWSNSEIIVIVPELATGLQNGPLMVRRADSKEDTSVDNPPVDDFAVSTTVRPGLCLANPNFGTLNAPFQLYGINFNGTGRAVRFGNDIEYMSANNVDNWTNTSVEAAVPNIARGRSTVYVSVDGENSNPKYFSVLQDVNNLPIIDYIDPASGPNSQYITIYGSGFMSYQAGVSEVAFTEVVTDATTTADGSDFPVQCRDSWWHSRSITVKVPAGINLGEYRVAVTNNAGNTSEPRSFVVNNNPLGPGICLLDPHNGPANTVVNIYGDNLGGSPGTVEFFDNVMPGSYARWENQNVEVAVPTTAASGPVVVNNGAADSNSLPFTVGSCTTDSECDGDTCCTSGIWAGICRPAGDCTSGFVPTSFGWTFSTAAGDGDDDDDDSDSCQGRAQRTNTCYSSGCPNSPGLCSPYDAADSVPTGMACDDTCSGVAGCTSATCSYDSNLDTCVLDNFCSTVVPDIFGSDLAATCVSYEGAYRWQVTTNASCPPSVPSVSNWVRVNSNTCVDTQPPLVGTDACNPCPSNFSCRDLNIDNNGECVYNQRLCAGSARCEGAQCVTGGIDSCECCCREDRAAEDCCAPLTCEGDCGANSAIVDGASVNFGSCTGCANAGATQDARDAACNCTGHTGKFCSTETNPAGICVDCSSLSSTECSNHSACCVDGKNGNKCRGVGTDGERYLDSGTQYCAYFDCTVSGPVASCSTGQITGEYRTSALCSSNCIGASSVPAGQRCQTLNCPYGLPSCGGLGIFQCLDNSTSDCRCCCDPGTNTCPAPLQCLADKGSCTGNTRGLCCGCKNDDECFGGDWDGCGLDACCSARPNIDPNSLMPADTTIGVCRNPLIRAKFDQKMNIESFTGNMILLGDYGSGTCPAGTQYLALGGETNKKIGMVQKIKNVFNKILAVVWQNETALAQLPVAGNTYCAVRGTASGYQGSDGFGVIQFAPSVILDENRMYFAVVLGDKNLDDAIKEGVLSNLEIGMNGNGRFNDGDAIDDNNNTFNAITYQNSFIWAFQTGANVCELNTVTVTPASFMFSIPNSIQPFTAEPKAANGQTITPIPMVYEWSWLWKSDNNSIVTVANNGTPVAATQDVTSQKVKDGKTIVSATASTTVNNLSNISSGVRVGRANVYVLLCDNPWPPRSADGTWAPWQDRANNCSAAVTNCNYSYNYELYYCRDAGKAGTYDDLPAIASSTAVTRGAAGSSLKETYFFREIVPVASSDLTLTDENTGTSIRANWAAVTFNPPSGYRLYMGTVSGTYSTHFDTAASPYTVTNLTRGVTYYFKLTALYPNSIETQLGDEKSITPVDTTAPLAPINFVAAPTTEAGEINLSWGAVSDAVSYKIYYGTVSGTYGSSQNVGNETSIILTGLQSTHTYYFTVTAIDAAGNESNQAGVASGVPL